MMIFLPVPPTRTNIQRYFPLDKEFKFAPDLVLPSRTKKAFFDIGSSLGTAFWRTGTGLEFIIRSSLRRQLALRRAVLEVDAERLLEAGDVVVVAVRRDDVQLFHRREHVRRRRRRRLDDDLAAVGVDRLDGDVLVHEGPLRRRRQARLVVDVGGHEDV